MQKMAEERPPEPVEYTELNEAIGVARSLETSHSSEVVEQACKLLEEIEKKLRDTDTGATFFECLQIYQEFEGIVQRLAVWQLFFYDRRGEQWQLRYQRANQDFESLKNHANKTHLLDSQIYVACLKNTEELGRLLQDYSELWMQLDECAPLMSPFNTGHVQLGHVM
jgi:hypothetical protein